MNYNLEAIRQLITNALTKDEFDDLVFFSFPSVEEKFINGQAQPQRIRILLEYVSKRRDIDKLLDLIEQKNPTVYKEFAPRLIGSQELETTSGTPLNVPPYQQGSVNIWKIGSPYRGDIPSTELPPDI
jgi:hypothetical protein